MNEIRNKLNKIDEITNTEYEVKYCPAFNSYEKTCTMLGLVCKHCNWCRIKSIVNRAKLINLGLIPEGSSRENLADMVINELGVKI